MILPIYPYYLLLRLIFWLLGLLFRFIKRIIFGPPTYKHLRGYIEGPDGVIVRSSFPSNSIPEKIAEEIQEAWSDYLKSGRIPLTIRDDKARVFGKTKDGSIIEMVIVVENKECDVCLVYPVITE